MAVAVLTLLVWAFSHFVQPILPPGLNSGLVLFFVALLAAMGALAQFKDVLELFQSLLGRQDQAKDALVPGTVITGPVQIVHGSVTNVTVNVTYIVQSHSFDNINVVDLQAELGFQTGGRVPRLAPSTSGAVVGRSREIAALKRIVFQESRNPGIVSLVGLAGIGKTTLAACLANDPDVERKFPDGTLWAFVGGSRDLRGILVQWLRALGQSPEVSDSDIGEWSILAIFLHAIQNKRILIVLDGVDTDNVKHLQALAKAVGAQSKVLITSRTISLPNVEAIVSLDVLPEREALLLIERGIARKLNDDEQGTAKEVAFLSGYLPLAIEMATTSMKRSGVSLQQLRTALRGEVKHPGALGLDDVRANIVASTFDRLFAQMLPRERDALLALANSEGSIDAKTLATIWNTGLIEAEHALVRLAQFSFIGVANGNYYMHPLIRELARSYLRGSALGASAS